MENGLVQTAARESAPPNLEAPPEELVRRYDVPGPRYTSYPTAPVWREPFEPVELEKKLEEAGRSPDEPLSMYVHIPFCKTLCTYCGCNVVISRDRKVADKYLRRLDRELELVTARLGERRKLSQIHWGGGTPTFLDQRQTARLWEAITSRFKVLPDAEVAIEINPPTTTCEQLSQLRGLGFNRISMGVQDFSPEVQRTINRYQGVDQTRELLEHARGLGFSGINCDLVYGLPRQTPEGWQRTLELVLQMRPDRFAVYAFAFLPQQIKHQRKLPVDAMPKGPAKLGLLLAAYQAMVKAGYQAIGMDHFALPDDELALAQSKRVLGRNFQGYTVKTAADVVAFGASAIADVRGCFAQNAKVLADFDKALDEGRLATVKGMVLSADDCRRRVVINSIMCNFWVDLGQDGASYFARELERLRSFESDGLVRLSGTELTVTPLGRYFLRNVAMVFDAHLADAKNVTFSRTV
ncbi:MAG: oxygen-independent coproporphyrinogen III oxidase [Myxococcales bacterium]|nr:oxygen-independent coproporphyrinogen III oxidase [Myxococcales bacterium]